jgi:purine-nucleoside phosphorylase
MSLKSQITEATDFIKSRTTITPIVGIILGTGLGGLSNEIEKKHSVDYADIPHFPTSTVESHKGRLIFGSFGGKYVVAMQGRFHFYEGYRLQQITFPVRVLKSLGIRMMITDHINMMGGKLAPSKRCWRWRQWPSRISRNW